MFAWAVSAQVGMMVEREHRIAVTADMERIRGDFQELREYIDGELTKKTKMRRED
jgi:hypothetical protein